MVPQEPIEEFVGKTWNFQGMCVMVWRTCPVSDDPEGLKLCPQGTISFSSLMPSISDTLGAKDAKFGTGVQCNKVFQHLKN